MKLKKIRDAETDKNKMRGVIQDYYEQTLLKVVLTTKLFTSCG